uniref:PiggyBac transposable element-derived protein domain-containing protein n=1 Tax=Phytophthora ramorum TaxID=164328 RepID=H3H8E0_PHYRM
MCSPATTAADDICQVWLELKTNADTVVAVVVAATADVAVVAATADMAVVAATADMAVVAATADVALLAAMVDMAFQAATAAVAVVLALVDVVAATADVALQAATAAVAVVLALVDVEAVTVDMVLLAATADVALQAATAAVAVVAAMADVVLLLAMMDMVVSVAAVNVTLVVVIVAVVAASADVAVMKDVAMEWRCSWDATSHNSGQTPDSLHRTQPARTPPIMLQEVYMNKLVAFTPERETWMKSKLYRPIGPAYIVGRVCRRPMRGKFASLFEIRWLDTQFQNAVEHVSVGCVQSGVENYKELTRLKDNPDWQGLVTGDADDDIDVDDDDNLQVVEEYREFDPGVLLPANMEEVEAIRNLRFEPNGEVDAPTDLYQLADGSTKTTLLPQYKHLFEHSATSSFFAYLPLYFWRQVLFETNKYAIVHDIKIGAPFTLAELMAFLGIMFYMALNDKA